MTATIEAIPKLPDGSPDYAQIRKTEAARRQPDSLRLSHAYIEHRSKADFYDNLLCQMEKYNHPTGRDVFIVSVYPPAECKLPFGDCLLQTVDPECHLYPAAEERARNLAYEKVTGEKLPPHKREETPEQKDELERRLERIEVTAHSITRAGKKKDCYAATAYEVVGDGGINNLVELAVVIHKERHRAMALARQAGASEIIKDMNDKRRAGQ